MKTKMKNSLFGTRNRTIVTLFVGLVLLALMGLVVYRQFFYEAPTPITADGQPVNLEPATEDEKKGNDQAKENAVKQTELDRQETSSGTKTANIIITSADANGVRAYVANIFEDGGVCTFAATLNGQTVQKTTAGFQNVSYTQCAPADWDAPLTAGNWSLSVSYQSPGAQGSQTRTIEVK